jgi:hypothetical protein
MRCGPFRVSKRPVDALNLAAQALMVNIGASFFAPRQEIEKVG